MARCSSCKIDKPDSEFHKNKRRKNGLAQSCKFCSKKYYDGYYKRNREQIIAKTTEYQKKHKEARAAYKRNWHLERSYGVSDLFHATLANEIGNVCAICLQPETKINNKTNKVQPLCVDHDHKTGGFRGLLCCRCNRMLGMVNDNTELLLSMYTYLKDNNELPPNN